MIDVKKNTRIELKFTLPCKQAVRIEMPLGHDEKMDLEIAELFAVMNQAAEAFLKHIYNK